MTPEAAPRPYLACHAGTVAQSPLLARIAAVVISAGAAAVAGAVIAGPAPDPDGYVSEAGIGVDPYASAYRLGLFTLAAGMLALAAALRGGPRGVPWLVGLAAVCLAGSGLVPCSEGCPLPPHAAASGGDLLHAGLSVTAVGAVVTAMPLVAVSRPAAARWRRASVAAAAAALPLGAANALIFLLVGRGALLGICERLLLVVVVLWLVVTALVARR